MTNILQKKNPSAETFASTTGDTPENVFILDLDNIGSGDATITCPDGTTFVLKAGTSKSISTGTCLDSFTIDASSTTVQAIYTY